jgi:hypothetical protein
MWHGWIWLWTKTLISAWQEWKVLAWRKWKVLAWRKWKVLAWLEFNVSAWLEWKVSAWLEWNGLWPKKLVSAGLKWFVIKTFTLSMAVTVSVQQRWFQHGWNRLLSKCYFQHG